MEHDEIQSLIHLHEDGALNRRELIERLVKYTGSVAAATVVVQQAGLLEAQTLGCAADIRVPENAPDLDMSTVTLYGEGGPLFAYLVIPREVELPRPAVLVIHENQGLTAHIKDVTRRAARAGFVALGIDLLSRQGGTDAFPDLRSAATAYNRTRPVERRADMITALRTLKDQPYVQGDRLGAVGFCAGGDNCIDLALSSPDLTAAAVYYGTVPNPADPFQNMRAAMLGIFPELDTGTTSGLPRLLTAFQQFRKTYELHVYGGTFHAFHNDTGARYDRAAACDAWSKTIAFFDKHLNAPRA